MRLTIFGWGNVLRGDDGLGPALLARVAAAGWPETTTVEDHQLQIEHALDLEGADCALFIDAGKDTPAPLSFYRLTPRRHLSLTAYILSPEAVLDIYARMKGEAPPPAFALCVRGESFDFGEVLSPVGAERLETAWVFVEALMRQRSLEAWDDVARRLPPFPRKESPGDPPAA